MRWGYGRRAPPPRSPCVKNRHFRRERTTAVAAVVARLRACSLRSRLSLCHAQVVIQNTGGAFDRRQPFKAFLRARYYCYPLGNGRATLRGHRHGAVGTWLLPATNASSRPSPETAASTPQSFCDVLELLKCFLRFWHCDAIDDNAGKIVPRMTASVSLLARAAVTATMPVS